MSCARVLAALLTLTAAFSPASAQTTAFVNVNVVPMDAERVLTEHTVTVENGVIVAMGPVGEVSVPEGAEVIDGTGAWLMPGLADMHVHLIADPSPDFMRLWLAEGVTTVRNLHALPVHQTWAEEVLSGARVGPTVYNTGPQIVGVPPDDAWLGTLFRTGVAVGPLVLFLVAMAIVWLLRGRLGGLGRMTLGGGAIALALGLALMVTKAVPLDAFTSYLYPSVDVVETEAEARAAVRRQAADGYRMVKIYEFMGGPVWLAAQDEAEQAGLYSISHIEPELDLADTVASGVDEIAHIDEFLEFFLTEPMSLQEFRRVPMAPERLPAVISTVAAQNLMVVSNMVVDENAYEYLEAGPDYFDRPEYAKLRPETRARWREGRVVRWQGQQEMRRNDAQPLFMALANGLHEAGVPLLVGTDVMVEGIVPWHLHREIELLVEAGLSRFEALKAATANAGESVRRAGFGDTFGIIAPGNRADLLLLRDNPLVLVGATQDRIGVMVRGAWFTQTELDALVDEFVARY